jgi:soluble lytic murein transglycosylase-like protein
MTAPPELVALARRIAQQAGLDPALVCAIIEQESAWNPWAVRYEPAFFARYVAPFCADNKISATEARARAFSWGLMQVMGQVARENGFNGTFLSALCDPEQGIAVGCRVLAKKLASAGGDVTRGLLVWNGGGNPLYAEQVLARRSHFAGKE